MSVGSRWSGSWCEISLHFRVVFMMMVSGFGGCGGDEAANQPPKLMTIQPQSYTVGEAHDPLRVMATDPEGDPLTFSLAVTLWPQTASAQTYEWTKANDPLPPAMSFITDPLQALLVWNPLANQVGSHEATFTVSDGHGRDQQKITLDVRPSGDGGGGAPLFITPSSYLLQLVQTDTLSAAIAVKDDDSARVTLTIQGEPEGLTFKVVSEDGKRGEFSWRPAERQIKERTIYSFVARAADDEGNQTEQQIRIVIRQKDGGGLDPNCPDGEPPRIEHLALRDQFGLEPFPLTARVTDDRKLQRVFAAFTTKDLQDFDSYQAAELQQTEEPAGSYNYQGVIPNLLAPGEATLTYYYYLCALDDDDPTGDQCDRFWCIPEEAVFSFVAHAQGQPGQCADDAREPNDGLPAATPLDPGTLPDLWLCPADEDWFAIEVRGGIKLYASILFAHALGDLALELLAADGTLLATSATSSDLEEVELEIATAGTYFLRITGDFPAESDGSGYWLEVGLSVDPDSCPQDPNEPNDERNAATPLAEGASGPFTLCPGDRDFYRIPVQAGEQVTIEVLFPVRDGDLEARLLAADGTVLRTASTQTDHERLSERAAAAGELLLEVWGFQGASNEYQLRVELEQGAACADLAQEPNDRQEQATPLVAGQAVEAAVCNVGGVNDVDWYQLPLPAFTGVRLHTAFVQAQGDLDLALFDQDRNLVGFAESTDDDEHIDFPGLAGGGTVFALIRGYQGAENRYELSTELVAFDQVCLPDLGEPNDDAQQAILFPVEQADRTIQPGLSLCGDEDWFAVDVPAGRTLLAAIDYLPQGRGSLSLAIHGHHGVLDEDRGASGNKTVIAPELEAGRYLVRVASMDGRANLYSLELMLE